jgi:hypothetical protein
MIRALGYSENRFDPRDPGRLCRGRERWIEPWDLEGDPRPMYRIVVSGATFSDDGASDARRGLPFAGVELVDVISALYPGAPMLAFMEDGHPADIPPAAQGVEAYEGYRAGGRQELGMVRWYMPIPDRETLHGLLEGGPPEDRVRLLVVLREAVEGPARDAILSRAFELVGFSTLDSPPARYQPAALPDLVARARAVLVWHRDKHGPALAVYTEEPMADLEARLEGLRGAEGEPLVVPFAIPPMLARWDRALAELRAQWSETRPFPVPAAPPGSGPRFDGRFDRRRRHRDDEEIDSALEEPPPSAIDEGEE